VKALRLSGWKRDAELCEVPEPTPGPGEVLVRIGGAGACHSDLHLMYDIEAGALPWGPPFTLGHENAGWVERVGDGVRSVSVGEPVAVYGPWGCGRCRRCLMGMENYCEHPELMGGAGGGLGSDGGMAPYMIVPTARWLVPIGDLDPVEAAPLTDAGLTPYHAIKRSLPLLVPGATVVVIGAGGLGHMAVQMLEAMCPASVITVDTRVEALELAAALGSDHTVLASDSSVDEIRQVTGGRGADVVLDFVGADRTLEAAAKLVRPMGHLTIVGIAGGTLPVSFFGIAYEASVATTYWGTLPELVEVIALAQARRIRPRVHTFSLDNAMDAYRSMRNGTLEGRAVIVPGERS
jgi:propanol-preferring alcohol dehydrogenase